MRQRFILVLLNELLMTRQNCHDYHRLNGSSSPVLMATCLSYGSLCDFIFFSEPTWMSHPSTDFDTKWLKRRGFTHTCAFWSKNRNFLKLLTPRPPKPPKFAKFWPARSISHLILGVSGANTFVIGAQ